MIAIREYVAEIPIGDVTHHCLEFEMPRGARVLTIRAKDRTVRAWALADDDEPVVVRRLVGIAEGCEIAEASTLSAPMLHRYQSVRRSVVHNVYHVFDLGEVSS